jgi:hypothetical protein
MKRNLLGLTIGLMLVTLACGLIAPATPTQPGVETVVAATFQALTSIAPATRTPTNGTTIAINNITFVIPTGVGSSAQVETIEAVPPSEDMPWWEIAPTYNKYLIKGYPLPETFHKPVIYIYPVDEYIQVNEDVASLVNKLKMIINSPGQPLPENLPFLPAFNAGQVFYSNTQTVNFQSGSGIRYITQFSQAPTPITNHEVFFTFQGLTSDSRYYIAAILPINTATLAKDSNLNTVTPPGGVPFDWNPDNFEMIPAYIDSVKQMLNATDPNAFNPTLPMLDTLIQSITVNSQ